MHNKFAELLLLVCNPNKWRTNVLFLRRWYERCLSRNPDAVYTFSNGKPRYDFVVHPGAKPEAIALRPTGADAVKVSKQNGVELSTSVGTVIQWGNIYAYRGNKRTASARRVALHSRAMWWNLMLSYNLKHPLIIDPLVYSTYYGGTGIDEITGRKLDTPGMSWLQG